MLVEGLLVLAFVASPPGSSEGRAVDGATEDGDGAVLL